MEARHEAVIQAYPTNLIKARLKESSPYFEAAVDSLHMQSEYWQPLQKQMEALMTDGLYSFDKIN